MQGRELTEWEELAGGYAVFCHCLYQPTREKYFQKAEQWLQDERIKVYAAVEENRLLGMIVLCIQGQQCPSYHCVKVLRDCPLHTGTAGRNRWDFSLSAGASPGNRQLVD